MKVKLSFSLMKELQIYPNVDLASDTSGTPSSVCRTTFLIICAAVLFL